MTRAAQEFVRPLTFSSLTGRQDDYEYVERRGVLAGGSRDGAG